MEIPQAAILLAVTIGLGGSAVGDLSYLHQLVSLLEEDP